MAALRKQTITAGVPQDSGTVSTIDTLAAMLFGTVTTLTRPANTTLYAANDAISNNATPASVIALSATVSDTNDDPIEIEALLLDSTDTGLAGTNVRAWIYNSDPTASSGVVGGDNSPFSNKRAGFVGTMSGYMNGFSDGAKGRLIPDAGHVIKTPPGAGTRTLWVQYQTLDGFQPSGNSTTLIGTIIAKQGRA